MTRDDVTRHIGQGAQVVKGKLPPQAVSVKRQQPTRAVNRMASSEDRPPNQPPATKYKYEYEYEGIPMTFLAPKESLDAMKTFEMRDGDVVVLSYPKSGTSWTYQIVHEILDGKPETKFAKVLETVPDMGYETQPVYAQLQQAPSPRLIWTHLPFQLAPPGLSTPINKVKVIVILRNPKDVSVSYYYFRQNFQFTTSPESWEQHAKDFLDGTLVYGDYFDHVLGWWQRKDDPHFLFVKYEDMKKDFPSWVKTIAAFLEKELTDEDLSRVFTNCSMESIRKTLAGTIRKDVVRKGIVGDWKDHYSAEQSAKLDQKYRERMAGSGLEFEFE
ncbi:sulfotransferase 6B1-like isoform X2 [Branchiostoma lanceolatum]|uniref:sulfotransferase 6B1-like isoform X2 n=1 Tax=Branchiostoma lanceolatum TaxID=7740 RepID=UPI0034545E1A